MPTHKKLPLVRLYMYTTVVKMQKTTVGEMGSFSRADEALYFGLINTSLLSHGWITGVTDT